MKHDLCTNPILASQLPHTDVSPACIHRHISRDATLACVYGWLLLCTSTNCLNLIFTTRLLSVFTYLLVCLLLYFLWHCSHLSHTFLFPFLFITVTILYTLLPHNSILYSCSPPISAFLPLSLSSPSQQCSRCTTLVPTAGGMGGPVLLAEFNEFLWGSDQCHQKWHSVLQPARFKVSYYQLCLCIVQWRHQQLEEQQEKQARNSCDPLSDGRGLQRIREISHEWDLHICCAELSFMIR